MATLEHGPWIDVHAHPGACFLRGLPTDHPAHRAWGSDRSATMAAPLHTGEVTVAAFATVTDADVIGFRPNRGLGALRDFEPGEVLAGHQAQVDAIVGLTDGATGLHPVLAPDDVDALHAAGLVGAWVTCEGGDFVETDVARVADAHARGVRSVTLVHYRINELGDIQTEEPRHGGLTPLGREVVAALNDLGMVVDLAHATFATTADAAEASRAPIMVSHSHLAMPGADHPRLLSDDHARLVAATGGVIGMWPAGFALRDLDHYVDEIARLVDLVGLDHVAIGTDMDANFQPVLDRYEQLPDLGHRLIARGFTSAERDAVMGGSFLRMWREAVAVSR